MDISVEIQETSRQSQVLPWALTAIGLLWLYGLLWWALGAIAVAALIGQCWIMARNAAARRNAVLARAEQQHRQVMRGDERGIYGAGYAAWRDYRELTLP